MSFYIARGCLPSWHPQYVANSSEMVEADTILAKGKGASGDAYLNRHGFGYMPTYNSSDAPRLVKSSIVGPHYAHSIDDYAIMDNVVVHGTGSYLELWGGTDITIVPSDDDGVADAVSPINVDDGTHGKAYNLLKRQLEITWQGCALIVKDTFTGEVLWKVENCGPVVMFRLTGAGGGGGAPYGTTAGYASAGGGGGGTVCGILDFTKYEGQIIKVVLGLGGYAGGDNESSNSSGQPGGNSHMMLPDGKYIIAPGGGGGSRDSNGSKAGAGGKVFGYGTSTTLGSTSTLTSKGYTPNGLAYILGTYAGGNGGGTAASTPSSGVNVVIKFTDLSSDNVGITCKYNGGSGGGDTGTSTGAGGGGGASCEASGAPGSPKYESAPTSYPTRNNYPESTIHGKKGAGGGGAGNCPSGGSTQGAARCGGVGGNGVLFLHAVRLD